MEESIPEFKIFKLNLKVVGFVDLKDDALSIIRGGYSVRPLRTNKDENILIVNWSATCSKIIDTFYEENVKSGGKHYGRPVYTKIIVFLDRDSIINPWDIQSSIEKINRIESQIINKVSLLYKEAHIINRVKSTLIRYQWTSQTLKFQFIIVSLPVFFISWYMGTTVSDVSYNLRRREIGLLLTKGFSRGQIFRMFLGEALLIGILGSVFGIFLSIILVFFMIRETFLNFGLVIGFDTVLMTIIFSVALSLLMIFQPARRASKLDIVDALQEYRYVEDIKPYKKKWPWIAFILGTYKIVIWLLGVNLIVLFMENPPVHNIFLMIILGIWMFFDSTILNSIGPFLFFWGVTKIFIRGSFAFQKAVEKITKPISDLSVLSTKNINRNPARTAAVAFLIAMIIGYAFQVIGTYASTQDYILRQIKFYVGSDISLETRTIENISSIIDKIENLSEALSVTIEYIFHGITADEERSLRLVAVNPSEWPRVAYTEDNLFKGEDMVSAFQKLKNDNFTIILDIGIAEDLKLGLGDNICLKILTATGYRVFSLKIVGFFGTKIQSSPYFPGINRYYLWSYVPEAFYKCIQRETESYGKVLVKICGDSDGKEVVKKIRDLQLPGVIAIYSVDEILEEWREGTLGSSTSTPILLSFVGSEEIQRIGVVIAVLAASIGTFIVTLIN
ncbi:TPA: FtsX-like permease family protein, partial [Candidatus Bathyarchaeota archaeon]|nr:FtsX-like permease family protein [Candidatus Bathyarchaeota archaeon]